MVGTEPDGSGAMCARVCVVDDTGATLLSTYVAPTAPVTDHRTPLTGVTPESLASAPSIDEVRARVLSILDHGRTLLVGHDLAHDLECLGIDHPPNRRRDTARYPVFERHTRTPFKLRTLAAELLGEVIQAEGAAHDPREDAMAAMRLYLGARGLCRAHHPDGVAETARGETRPKGGSGSRDADVGEGRFRCWCGDLRDSAERRARPTQTRRAAKTATGPSPAKTALRDATNAAWGGSRETR